MAELSGGATPEPATTVGLAQCWVSVLPEASEAREPLTEIPLPSDVGVYVRAGFTAIFATMPERKARKALRIFAGILADEASVAEILSLRPTRQQTLTRKAVAGAVALFRVHLPAYLAGLRR